MQDRPLVNHAPKPTVGADEHLVTPQDVVVDETRLSCLKDVKPDDPMAYIKAIAKEIFDVVRFGCFKLSLPPPHTTPLSTHFVLKIKIGSLGNYLKHKARLCVRGFASVVGTDFFSTFSPMSELSTVRTILAIAAKKNQKVYHSDVPSALVQAYIDSDVYVRLPDGISFVDPQL